MVVDKADSGCLGHWLVAVPLRRASCRTTHREVRPTYIPLGSIHLMNLRLHHAHIKGCRTPLVRVPSLIEYVSVIGTDRMKVVSIAEKITRVNIVSHVPDL